MQERKYDIFISYRRDGGAQYARILQLMLIQRGYKVFLDYDELTDGIFSDKIRAAIREAPVFMLVLSQGAFQRCVNDGDWVRQEITLAIEQQKHIVPVNPDNSFDGFPDGMPEQLKEAIGSHQHSEISFGQALGATIDLMIKNRLVSTLGQRSVTSSKDEDYEAAKESLRRQDAHNRFMKRLGIVAAVAVLAVVMVTCFLFWRSHEADRRQSEQRQELADMQTELEKNYKAFGLQLSPGLTQEQMNTIDDMLSKMAVIRNDTLWMSQFECSVGWWYGVLGSNCDEAQRDMPMTEVSYGDICMTFLDSLRNMTNIEFDLPSADEWEYAARGGMTPDGTRYAGSDDADRVAWYKDNAEGHAHPSNGQQGKEPNACDLYDMSGNVAEWCNTPFEGSMFTVCGGDYTSSATDVTVTSRRGADTNAKEKTIGFRLVIRKIMD